MKVYTKTGDKGTTSLVSGTRVDKTHPRLHAYGTVDELNSWTGLLRDTITDETRRMELIEIQDRLFTIGSHLANDGANSQIKLPSLKSEDITYLENAMDSMDETLAPLRAFVLPGGHPTVSYCHIARTVCRRAERYIVELRQIEEIDELLVTYINRLSDYFFVLSRKLTADLNAQEIPWVPSK